MQVVADDRFTAQGFVPAVMGQTYKVTGINLKSVPLGESDRLLTILTQELGLLRAIAPGARKQNSKLGGRSGLFVVNELLLHKGRSLDKITQAESVESYPGLSRDLGKLAAAQYLAEVSLLQSLSYHAQPDLFYLLCEHLSRLESLPCETGNPYSSLVLAHLSHGIFHLLALAGIAPQVHACCVTQHPLIPDFNQPDWQVGFSVGAGGTVNLSTLHPHPDSGNLRITQPIGRVNRPPLAAEGSTRGYQTILHPEKPIRLDRQLNAIEVAFLQQLAQPQMPEFLEHSTQRAWVSVEHVLRLTAQYHFDQPIRSAALIDSYFASLPIS